MLKQNPSRIFTGNPYDVGMPNLIGGKVEINSLVPPPKHLSEFALS